MRSQPGTFRPERLLRDLNDDLLSFLEELFDLGVGLFFPVTVPIARTASARSRGGYATGRRLRGWVVVVVLDPGGGSDPSSAPA